MENCDRVVDDLKKTIYLRCFLNLSVKAFRFDLKISKDAKGVNEETRKISKVSKFDFKLVDPRTVNGSERILPA